MFDTRTLERFWSKVDRRSDDECWPWLGATDGRYGQFWFDRRKVKANRFAIAVDKGVWLGSDQLACHHCDNPICVNPSHLFIGSMSDNIRDAVAKERIDPAVMLQRNHNSEKTHCIRGHSLSGYNLVIKNGRRSCRECQQMHHRKYLANKARATCGDSHDQ